MARAGGNKLSSQGFQLPLFTPQTTWSAPRMSELPEYWRLPTSQRIGLDTESKDPRLDTHGPGFARGDGRIIGVSLSSKEMGACYIPLFHEGGGNVEDPGLALQYIAKCVGGDHEKVGANILYDCEGLAVENITVRGRKRDIIVAEALCDEYHTSYSLEAISRRRLGRGKDEALLREAALAYGVDAKKSLWRLPAGFVGPYAMADADLPELILEKQLQEMAGYPGLAEAFELESEVLDVLLAMRLRGVRVDLARAEQVREKLLREEAELQIALNKMAGLDIDVWSGQSLEKLWRKEGIPINYTAKGNPSFTADYLEAHKHPLAKAVVRVRKLGRARETFIDTLFFDHGCRIDHQRRTAYIHAVFKSTHDDDGGVRHGRFACQKPNLQQIPKRDEEIGPLIRSCFIAEEGEVFASCDYSAQEPRMQDHLAISTRVPGWELVRDAYAGNPNLDRHQWVADLMGMSDQRKKVKVLNLSIAYGAGLPSVTDQLNCSKEEAIRLLNLYYASAPFVKGLQDNLSGAANDRGWIRLMGGRYCRFPFWEPANGRKWDADGNAIVMVKGLEAAQAKWPGVKLKRAMTHKALNRWVQGSCSYQTKVAMVIAYKEGIIPQLPVHDELAGSRKNPEEAHRLARIMMDAVPLMVPCVVDPAIGDSWAKAA